jgi:rRNA biogenesis protein RRP5
MEKKKTQNITKAITKAKPTAQPTPANEKNPKAQFNKKASSFNYMNQKSSKNNSGALLNDIKIAKRKTTQDSIDATNAPEFASSQDFEKNILRNPNDSTLWIKYISWCQESDGLALARKTAERALNVVNFKDDDSKLNIWKAYINIEFYFGTDDSCSELFKRGLAANDPFK